MSFVKVPPDLTRNHVGKRIIYHSNPPGLRVKIYSHRDFDEMKLKGRFSDIDSKELNFSTKVITLPEDQMEVEADEAIGVSVEDSIHDNAAVEVLEVPTAWSPLPSTRQRTSATPRPKNSIKTQVSECQ